MSSNYFQVILIFFPLLARVILTAVGADSWNCMAEKHLILESRPVETFPSRRWCRYPVGMHGFVHFPTLNVPKEGIVLFWPSPCVYCKFWGDFVVRDGESKNKKIILVQQICASSYAACVHRLFFFFWYLIKIFMFSSQFSGVQDIGNKAVNQVIFLRSGSQMIRQ